MNNLWAFLISLCLLLVCLVQIGLSREIRRVLDFINELRSALVEYADEQEVAPDEGL